MSFCGVNQLFGSRFFFVRVEKLVANAAFIMCKNTVVYTVGFYCVYKFIIVSVCGDNSRFGVAARRLSDAVTVF